MASDRRRRSWRYETSISVFRGRIPMDSSTSKDFRVSLRRNCAAYRGHVNGWPLTELGANCRPLTTTNSSLLRSLRSWVIAHERFADDTFISTFAGMFRKDSSDCMNPLRATFEESSWVVSAFFVLKNLLTRFILSSRKIFELSYDLKRLQSSRNILWASLEAYLSPFPFFSFVARFSWSHRTIQRDTTICKWARDAFFLYFPIRVFPMAWRVVSQVNVISLALLGAYFPLLCLVPDDLLTSSNATGFYLREISLFPLFFLPLWKFFRSTSVGNYIKIG